MSERAFQAFIITVGVLTLIYIVAQKIAEYNGVSGFQFWAIWAPALLIGGCTAGLQRAWVNRK